MGDDPSGSVVFISKLFTGLISNNSSFLKRACNCIRNEDAIVANMELEN
jgi:hypothetical protein